MSEVKASIIHRFSGGETKERLLGLVRLVEDFTAESIASQVLPLMGIVADFAVCIGLTTDMMEQLSWQGFTMG